MGTPTDIQAMLDRREIVELTSRYAFLVDTFQLLPLMQLWVDETMHAAAYYDDVYERVDDTWKFKSRTVYPLTTPQLGSLVS